MAREADEEPVDDAGAARLARLLGAMESLPVQPSAGLRVVWLCDDPRSGAPEVGDAVEADAILTARLLRVANSALYGLRSPVANPRRAVAVLGTRTTKVLATLATWGVYGGRVGPEFWEHAALVASGARLLAPELGVDPDDAFAAGLLHEIGIPLLERAADRPPSATEPGPGDAAWELATFGVTHAAAAGAVLGAWRLPAVLCEAVAGHLDPPGPDTSPLGRLLAAAESLAEALGGGLPTCRPAGAPDLLRELGFDAPEGDPRALPVAALAGELAAALAVGSV
jgi:HD-like signal output (HDOD) protein